MDAISRKCWRGFRRAANRRRDDHRSFREPADRKPDDLLSVFQGGEKPREVGGSAPSMEIRLSASDHRELGQTGGIATCWSA
jgi:hypothetical protein